MITSNRVDQDVLIKINIPRSERVEALTYLDSIEINRFSLFQTEDSLMKTLLGEKLKCNLTMQQSPTNIFKQSFRITRVKSK